MGEAAVDVGDAFGGSADPLLPYVPRVLARWLAEEPGIRHRQVEGTLAFFDLSGFTRLTERLARSGKVGAEELSDVLDSIFGELVRVAAQDGADLLKWGGDAVLLLHTGVDHAARAVHAAIAMRRTLGRIGRLRTDSGPVRMRASAGLHSGLVDLVLVGDPGIHRELVVAGPAATLTAVMEQAASAGQVVVSPATAALLDPRVVGGPVTPDSSGRLVVAAPRLFDQLAERSASSTPARRADLSAALPLALRARLADARREPEHRAVAVAFLRFTGTDSLANDGGQALVDALDEVVGRVQRIAAEHEVTFLESDIDRDGGKILLVAGAPSSAGHDEDRLLHAVRHVVDQPGRLPLRAGVTRGHVFTGDFGPPFRRTYSIKGDVVNLAARLVARANPGEVLATTSVVQHCRGTIARSELAPFHVKGKQAPVRAVVVHSVDRSVSTLDAQRVLVGRDRELAVLLDALERARGGRGGAAVVTGEPGIGKSRLVDELVARADGMRVLRATCSGWDASAPYSSVRALLLDCLPGGPDADLADRLRAALSAAAPALLPWLPLLAIPFDVRLADTPQTAALDEQFRKARLEESLVTLLAAVLDGPTLFCVDDAGEMDDASADLLHEVVAAAAARPWLVIVARRPGREGFVVRPGGRVRQLEVGSLSPAASRELAERATQDVPAPPAVLDAMVRRAEGHPLFLLELLASTVMEAVAEDLPASVEGLFTAQVDQLAPPERALLRLAAVLGPQFPIGLLDQLRTAAPGSRRRGSPDQMLGALDQFLRRDGSIVRFRHVLLRDVAYAGLPFRRRRQLHAVVAAVIEDSATDAAEHADALSAHYFHAGRHDKAFTYSRLAAQRARSRFAHVDSIELFARAAESARRAHRPRAELVDVLEELGDVSFVAGLPERAAQAYAGARRAVDGDALRLAQLALKQARTDQRLGRLPVALGRVTRGLSLLADVNDSAEVALTRSLLRTRYAVARISQGRCRDAHDMALQAAEDARRSGDQDALAQAYLALHTASIWLGLQDEHRYGEAALAIWEALDDHLGLAHCRNDLAILALFDGRWGAALTMFAAAADDFASVGDDANAANATYNRADVLVRQGRTEEAVPLLEDALRVARGVGDEELVALVLRESGRAAARAGRHDEAARLLAEARVRLEELGEPQEVVDVDAAAAEALLLRGDWVRALEAGAAALQQARSLGAATVVPALHRVRGSAMIAGGDVVRAVSELRAGLAVSADPGMRHEHGFLLEALARALSALGDPQAQAVAAESERTLTALGVLSVPTPAIVTPTP